MKKAFLITLTLIVAIVILWINPHAKKQIVDTSGWVQLIPSNKLDKRIDCQNSNNNLDAIAYEGMYYVAFRTAPNHFASTKTKLYILSSSDLKFWNFENEITVGADLREPRFVINKDILYFYYFEGGRNMLRFEPNHIWMTSKTSCSNWQTPMNLKMDGFVPWNLRSRNDTIFLSAYYGKELYTDGHEGNQRLFYSTTGKSFQPISEQAQITDKGVEEGAFIFDSIGNIWGNLRLEGNGAMTFFADKSDLSKWKTVNTTDKYDSALLFEHNKEIYVVSRRNMDGASKKGNFRLYNLVRYSLTRKKTALFHFNKANMKLDWICDFPSTGDNAFPGIIPLDENRYFLLNYSTNIYGKEKNWIKGQFGKTYIYSTILNMKEVLSKYNQD